MGSKVLPLNHLSINIFLKQKGGKTIMIDVFDYVSPYGILGKLADWLFLKRYMTDLLVQRNNVIKEYAENHSDRLEAILHPINC